MRQFTAMTTPEHVVEMCRRSIKEVIPRDEHSIIPGTQLNHFAFVVSKEAYGEWREEFLERLDGGMNWELACGARMILGMQKEQSGLSWEPGKMFPGLALVEANPAISIRAGGAYAVMHTPSIVGLKDTLKSLETPYHVRSLYKDRDAIIHGGGSDLFERSDCFGLVVTEFDFIPPLATTDQKDYALTGE